MDRTHRMSLGALSALSILLALPAALVTGCSRPAGATSAERDGVAATVRLYFKGHATGDGKHVLQAFHPDAKIFSIKDGTLAALTRAEFAARFPGKPKADEARRDRKILSIDIAGDAAVAKVELRYPDAHIVDYLSLVKLDGSWTIINKVFHRGNPISAASEASQRPPAQGGY